MKLSHSWFGENLNISQIIVTHLDKYHDRGVNRELWENTGVRRQHLPQTNEEGSVDEVAFESGLGGREDNVPDEEGAGHSRQGELLVPRHEVL